MLPTNAVECFIYTEHPSIAFVSFSRNGMYFRKTRFSRSDHERDFTIIGPELTVFPAAEGVQKTDVYPAQQSIRSLADTSRQ